jgi:hypothetical protein
MPIDRKVADDRLEGFFLGLGADRERYARAQWRHLKQQGPMPNPTDFGISARDGEQIRVILAQHL